MLIKILRALYLFVHQLKLDISLRNLLLWRTLRVRLTFTFLSLLNALLTLIFFTLFFLFFYCFVVEETLRQSLDEAYKMWDSFCFLQSSYRSQVRDDLVYLFILFSAKEYERRRNIMLKKTDITVNRGGREFIRRERTHRNQIGREIRN